MVITSSYPVVMTDKVAETAGFYRDLFGFETTFDAGWYVSLKNEEGEQPFELAVLQFDHESVPDPFRSRAQGVLINLEVEDATAEYERIQSVPGIQVVKELRDEEFGQRHFILVDPSGTLVDVVENIPPSEAFLANYQNG
jgi:predicted enzyme related to lactoylglutathione lyase